MMQREIDASPRLWARVAGGFYMVTVVASLYEHFFAGGTPLGHAAGLLSGATYLVVVWLLYELLRPVSPGVSLLAAFFGLVGIAKSDNSIALFGVYCVVLGFLIARSTFLPRIFGLLMALGGAGLLVNAYGPLLWPSMPHLLSTVGYTLDAGEIVFALWLLGMGVNERKWSAQSDALRTGLR